MENSDNTVALAENKVLILYLLNQIPNGIIENGLYKIVTSINNLIDTKLVGQITKDEDETIIKITSEGKNALSLTQDVLPGLIKLKADNIFREELSSVTEETSVTAEFIPKNENDYTIKCKIVENNETLFEVRTVAGSRDRAKRIVDNWNSNASKIYPKILDILLEDKKD